jgi:hypothetical protein
MSRLALISKNGPVFRRCLEERENLHILHTMRATKFIIHDLDVPIRLGAGLITKVTTSPAPSAAEPFVSDQSAGTIPG